MGSVVDALNEFVLGPLWRECFSPLWSDGAYLRGFAFGLILSLVVGWVSRRILFLRALVSRYYRPTQVPATEPGPSPRQIAAGCRGALLELATWIVFFLLVLSVIVQGILHGGQ